MSIPEEEEEGGKSSLEEEEEEVLPVLHVMVIGFHHKKGCIVEYSWPPVIPGKDCRSPELPSQWRHLPSLALPDGSHNFEHDTAYFHLPALDNPRKTVFGISSYRQINSETVLNKTEDITRASVQKSVCVLSRLPLYGQIQVKMKLITEAYFRERDFTRLDLIHETYKNLNSSLSNEMLFTQRLYVGLSARNFVSKFRQRTLVLFKLLLLEKKVVFFQSPVNELCEILLTLLSLHPGMLEAGLDEAACMVPVDTPPMSPTNEDVRDEDEGVLIRLKNSSVDSVVVESPSNQRQRYNNNNAAAAAADYHLHHHHNDDPEKVDDEQPPPVPNFTAVSNLSTEELGLPLKIFTGGNLCHPYLSLSYIDALTQPSVHGYVIGATNILFKQKKNISDVIVDIPNDCKIEVFDPDLKRALALTTEDLRFMDNVVKRATNSNYGRDDLLDGVGWEGGDEWVRAQFRFYLACLLRSSFEDVPQFNSTFFSMWKQTKNYKVWLRSLTPNFADLAVGHPFTTGQLSMTDMKLHLSNTMTNSEGGKRVSAAVANTGKAVAGGLSSAKGAFSSWIGSFKQDDAQ